MYAAIGYVCSAFEFEIDKATNFFNPKGLMSLIFILLFYIIAFDKLLNMLEELI